MAAILTLGGKTTLHPRELFDAAQRLGTPTDFWGRANSFSCPRGKQAGICWLLMRRELLDELTSESAGPYELKWTTLHDNSGDQITIESLYLVNSTVTHGALANDKDAAVLLELADRRHQFKLSSIDSQYNVRMPAPSGNPLAAADDFYTDSLNGGAVWTWQTLLTDIWGNLPSTPAGTAPTLPYTPDGTPENWRFIGENAWEALHQVLDKIECTTVLNPFTGAFSYVRLGTDQATNDTLSQKLTPFANRLILELDPGQYNKTQMPETVRVFFARREVYHGVEKDTVKTGNWEISPSVSKDYATGFSNVESGSVLPVWDDLPALFNTAGTNTNSAALQTRADEIGENIANNIDKSAQRFRRHYKGLLLQADAILPGSEVSEIHWRDYGDAWGQLTEVRQAAMPMRADNLRPTTIGQEATPLYPRIAHAVQVDDGSSDTGDELTANASGLYPGFVMRWIGSHEQLEACWIRPLDLESGSSPSEATVIMLRQKDRFHGRLYGSQTVSNDTRPVYVVRAGLATSGEAIECGTVLFETGTACAGCTGDTLAGHILDITDVVYSFPTQVEPNGKVTLVQESGDSCEWRSAPADYILTVFGGGSTRQYYWKLKYAAGSPGTWTLTLHDNTDDSTVITLDGTDASPSMSDPIDCTATYAWTGSDVTLTASKIDAGYDFEDTGAGFCLNPT